MTKNDIPTVVPLRSERKRLRLEERSPHDMDTNQTTPYTEGQYDHITKMLESANGDPTRALENWFAYVKPNLVKTRGVHLIPGQIQRAAKLPVRQVYRHEDALYRIEPTGEVTEQLL